jgi:hypothetical protein
MNYPDSTHSLLVSSEIAVSPRANAKINFQMTEVISIDVLAIPNRPEAGFRDFQASAPRAN